MWADFECSDEKFPTNGWTWYYEHVYTFIRDTEHFWRKHSTLAHIHEIWISHSVLPNFDKYVIRLVRNCLHQRSCIISYICTRQSVAPPINVRRVNNWRSLHDHHFMCVHSYNSYTYTYRLCTQNVHNTIPKHTIGGFTSYAVMRSDSIRAYEYWIIHLTSSKRSIPVWIIDCH